MKTALTDPLHASKGASCHSPRSSAGNGNHTSGGGVGGGGSTSVTVSRSSSPEPLPHTTTNTTADNNTVEHIGTDTCTSTNNSTSISNVLPVIVE